MEREVRYCTTEDGVRIAYCVEGEGPPLILSPMWISSIVLLGYDEDWVQFLRRLGDRRQLVLIDQRGTGASDRDFGDFSRSALVKDVKAVADHLALRRVSLLSIDFGCRVALEFASRYPDRVSRVALYAPSVNAGDMITEEARSGLVNLIRGGWQLASQIFPLMIMPGVSGESQKRFFLALRESCTADVAAAWLEACFDDDLSSVASQVQAETLVLHGRDDIAAPFEFGRKLAALLPNSRIVSLKRSVHAPYIGDTTEILDALGQFLPARRVRRALKTGEEAPSGVRTVLFTDVVGHTEMMRRLGDERGREVLREHERITREALKAHGGTEVKTMGDGFMASFASAVRALECAVAIQRAFDERNASLPAHPEALEGRAEPQPSAHASTGSARADRSVGAEPIRVRIGLNAGEPIAEDEDLFGAAVIRAARIAALAQANEILVANVVRDLAEGKGFMFSDRGEIVLRGFDDPVRLFEVRWAQA